LTCQTKVNVEHNSFEHSFHLTSADQINIHIIEYSYTPSKFFFLSLVIPEKLYNSTFRSFSDCKKGKFHEKGKKPTGEKRNFLHFRILLVL